MRKLIAALLAAVFSLPTLHARPATELPAVSFASLLEEMTDPSMLAFWPKPNFTLKQASSYDRLSRVPGNYNWFANRDWSNFLRAEKVKTADGERTEYIMLEEHAPGALVRFWVGGYTDRGQIRIYVDGAEEPLLSGTADEMVGGNKYFSKPFAEVNGRGHNLYAPIPYAKSIKVTYDGPLPEGPGPGDRGFWYNINYRVYPPSTLVESLTLDTLASLKYKLARVGAAISDAATALPYELNGTLPAGATSMQGPKLTRGPAALSRLQVRLRASDMEAALRQTILSITFDGQHTVQVPIGDFFGSGVGLNAFQDRWRRVDRDGNLSVRWVMPYKEHYQIALTNKGHQTVDYELAVKQIKWKWDERSLYFHANWRRESFQAETKGDFNYLTASGGRGVYIGDTLSLFNPVAGWWGEGDEKVWVDAEKFPSHFGTGTEDYYGYAWGAAEFFNSPFVSQPRVGEGNRGHTTNSRVRVLDGIPFSRSIKFDMEVWHPQRAQMDYAVTTFWYGDESAQANTSFDNAQLSIPAAATK